jgi:phage terminase small subunit
MEKLNPRQRAFADFYIESLNATESAIKAGYSRKTAKVIANENLTKPYIKAYVQQRLAEKESERIMKQDEVLQLLTSIARGEVTEEQVVVEGHGDGVSAGTTIEKQVSAKERVKALELLGKRYGLYVDKMELNGNIGIQIVDDVK